MAPQPTLETMTALVLDAIGDLRSILADDELPAEVGLDTALLAEDGALDSLGVVNLVVLTERRVQDTFGVAVSLADEDALSAADQPFQTVETFVAFTQTVVQQAIDAESQ